jgi:hypothetical protein
MRTFLHKTRIGRGRELQADRIVGRQLGKLEDKSARRIARGLTPHANARRQIKNGGTGFVFGRALAHDRKRRLRRRYGGRGRRRRVIGADRLNGGVRKGPPPHADVRHEAEGDEAQRERADTANDHEGPGWIPPRRARNGTVKSQRIMQIIGGHGFESVRLQPDIRESHAPGA